MSWRAVPLISQRPWHVGYEQRDNGQRSRVAAVATAPMPLIRAAAAAIGAAISACLRAGGVQASSKNVLRKELHRESCIVCSVRVRVAHVGLPENKRDYGHAHVPHASRSACLRAHARPWCAGCACWWRRVAEFGRETSKKHGLSFRELTQLGEREKFDFSVVELVPAPAGNSYPASPTSANTGERKQNPATKTHSVEPFACPRTPHVQHDPPVLPPRALGDDAPAR